MVQRIGPQQPIQSRTASPAKSGQAGQGQFGAMLQQELQRQGGHETQGVAFSKHAIARAEERGIQVDDNLMSQLNSSIEKAQAKGATNILAFDAQRAFIINVPHGRVITTMSQEEMKENIFTNIDGAVLL